MGGPGSGVSRLRTTPRKGANPLRGVDRRARNARAFLARTEAIRADLGHEVSTLRASLIDRCVVLESRIVGMERQALTGGHLDLNEYLAALQTLVRLADKIGLSRVARKVDGLDDLRMAYASRTSAPAPASGGPVQSDLEQARGADHE